jgi:hypothetical protein
MRNKVTGRRDADEVAIIDALLAEAQRRGLTRSDVVSLLQEAILWNESYRRRPSRRSKDTSYARHLQKTQPALALAMKLLQDPFTSEIEGPDPSEANT